MIQYQIEKIRMFVIAMRTTSTTSDSAACADKRVSASSRANMFTNNPKVRTPLAGDDGSQQMARAGEEPKEKDDRDQDDPQPEPTACNGTIFQPWDEAAQCAESGAVGDASLQDTISNETRTTHERDGERFRRKLVIVSLSW